MTLSRLLKDHSNLFKSNFPTYKKHGFLVQKSETFSEIRPPTRVLKLLQIRRPVGQPSSGFTLEVWSFVLLEDVSKRYFYAEFCQQSIRKSFLIHFPKYSEVFFAGWFKKSSKTIPKIIPIIFVDRTMVVFWKRQNRFISEKARVRALRRSRRKLLFLLTWSWWPHGVRLVM